MGKYDPAPTPAAGLIRLARYKAGLTQAGLATRAGVTQQTVSAYETGRKEPTLPTLQHLVAAAGYQITMRLEPLDDHDASLRMLVDALAPDQRTAIEKTQRERIEAARLVRVRGR